MNRFLINTLRLFIFVLAQGLIFGQLDFGVGIHPMIYPLFIILLPFDTPPILLLFISFISGIGVDYFMNTFGMHASSALIVALIRPFVFRQFAPRDGYDILKDPTASVLGFGWFLKVSSVIILTHHLWFFILEYFKWAAWGEILLNTLKSALLSLIIFVLIQVFFFKKPKHT